MRISVAGPSVVVYAPGDRPLRHVLGLLYVVVSVGLSLYSLYLFAPYLENDLFWSGFATLNTSAALRYVYNRALVSVNATSSATLLDVQALPWVEPYEMQPAYGRRLLYEHMTALPTAIASLRHLDSGLFTFLPAKYCWVGLERRWEMGVTTATQARCEANDMANGAAYLEAVLRNMDFGAWYAQNGLRFNMRVLTPLNATDAGAAWSNRLLTHTLVDVQSEVLLWEAHGIAYFQLLYSNHYEVGVLETIAIENALGVVSSFTIKSIASVQRGTPSWTTALLTGNFEFELQGPGVNQSLVRHTPLFYGDIDPTQVEVYLLGPFRGLINDVVHAQIGMLNNLRLRWVPPPPDWIAAVQSFDAIVLSALQSNAAFARAYNAVPASMELPPPSWTDAPIVYFGGNPMCAYGRPQSLPQESFSFDDVCSKQLPLRFTWTRESSLLVLVSGVDTSFLCSSSACSSYLASVSAAAKLLGTVSVALPASVVGSDVGLMQFVASVSNESDISLDMQRLFTPAWRPHGVACAYDWAQNVREVVSFEGDMRTLQLMSAAYTGTPTAFAPPSVSLGSYLLAMTAVITSVLCLVAVAIVLLSLGRHRRHAPPWLQFHRLTASVYLNRGLMSSRALTAALCLATAVVEPVVNGATMQLQAAPRPVWVSALLAAETLWVLYGGQELLHPLTPSSSVLFPVVSALGFSSIWLLDVLAPPTITATLSRSCLGIGMDVMLYCTSGHVQIGSVSRLLVLLTWLVALLLLSTLSVAVARWRQRRPMLCIEESAYMVLPPLAVAHWPRGAIAIDAISAVLCGLLFVSKTHVFDTKLWLWLSPDTFEWQHHCLVLLPPTMGPTPIVVGATPIKPTPPPNSWFKSKLAPLSLLFGCLYIVATLGSNVAYFNLVRDTLANDFFWAGFNATGSYAFVANALNQRLLTNTSTQLRLDATALIDYSQSYDESVATIAWPVTAASRGLQDENVLTLATAVRGLRTMDPCRLPWVFTQYCWLDVQQRWGMAHTQARQDRCKRHMASNAAVYLETALRNINDWGQWYACYGDSFATGFVDELQQSTAGQAFLASLHAGILLSVDDEVIYWRQANLIRYELQWQNFKTTGFHDAMLVENALGLAYALPLANVVGRFHPTRQTSHVMYWAFASDLWAVTASNASRIAGCSLLRSSSVFAFANVSSEQLLVDNRTLSYPLSSGFHALSSHVGPFNAVDMLFVPVPFPLGRFYALFHDALAMLSATDLEAQARYVHLPTKYFVLAVPLVWQALPTPISMGGNIFCGDNAVASPFFFGMAIGFGATSYCNSVYLEVMQPTPSQVLFALSAFNATSTPSMDATDYVDICSSDAIVDSRCVDDYMAGGAFLETYPALAFAAEATAAYDAMAAHNVTVLQYGRQSDGSSSLLQLSLLSSSDRIWSFYGWLLLYEWTCGMREVVAFTGDAGTVTTISLGVVPVTMPPDAGFIPQTYAFYCQQVVLYITIVLICMAIVVLGYTLHLRGHMESLNLLEFNRTVGIVWVGRSFLFVRSITALCLLHTSTLQLSKTGLGTLLASPPLHWTKIVLASSEATWLVYVLNDILSCVTQQYTPSYAYKSSLLTWSCTFLWTLLDAPPSATANVSRVCELLNMDDGLVCVSGRVQIGSVRRVYTTIGIALGCIVATYGIERMLQPQLRRRHIPSLLLNAQSVYCLLFREVNGACYLDKASAALAGLLTFSQGDVWYILDVKTWRLLVVRTRACADHGAHLHHCLPLSQL